MAGRFLALKDIAALRTKIADNINLGATSGVEREWWYLSGFFWEGSDERKKINTSKLIPDFGIHIAFFHLYGESLESLIGHASITDTKHRKYYRERNSIEFSSSQGDSIISRNTLEIRLNRWLLLANNRKKWNLSFQAEDKKVDLVLTVPDKLWLHGNNGMYKRNDNHFTFYYSIPFIEANGEIADLRGSGKRKIRGKLWYDHEIGPKVEKNSWRWFSLSFSDETAYMLYLFTDADKKTQLLVEKYSRQGSSGVFQGSSLSHVEFHFNKETKLKSGYSYPIEFKISYVDDTTKKTGVIIAHSLMAEQEFYASDSVGTARYWEGLVKCVKIEADKRVEGFGYVEDKPLW